MPKKTACPCCGCLTLTSVGDWEICEVCWWEDDPVQRADSAYAGGANVVALDIARANYARLGVSDPDGPSACVPRAPRAEEIPD